MFNFKICDYTVDARTGKLNPFWFGGKGWARSPASSTLDELAVWDQARIHTVVVPRLCPTCMGAGTIACRKCYGRMEVPCGACRDGISREGVGTQCPRCNGTGRCSNCDGTGRMRFACFSCNRTGQSTRCQACWGRGSRIRWERRLVCRQAHRHTWRCYRWKRIIIECRACGGDGQVDPYPCSRCGGEGFTYRRCWTCWGSGKCRECGGDGQVGPCPTCGGTGMVPCTACTDGRIACPKRGCNNGYVLVSEYKVDPVEGAARQWRLGRYYRENDALFISQQIELGSKVKGRLAEPNYLLDPYNKPRWDKVGAKEQEIRRWIQQTWDPAIKILGISWTAYTSDVCDHKPTEGGSPAVPLLAQIELSLERKVSSGWVHVAGPWLNADASWAPVFVQLPRDHQQIRYCLRFNTRCDPANTILLETPIFDDLTIYWASRAEFLSWVEGY